MGKEESILHILHTNDLHSHFEEMPHISTGLKTLRLALQEKGEAVVTVDVGDHMDRMSLKTEATLGKANIDVLNETGYDIAMIGNNEGLTLPRDAFDCLYDQAAFPVVCANLFDVRSGKRPDFLQPYLRKQYGDLTVGWIGVTASFPSVYELLGLTTSDPIQAVAEGVAALRSSVDVIVVLSHIGYGKDVELAQQVEGIDLILGAHTHTYLEAGERIGSTLICQTGKFGQYIGHVTVAYNKQTKTITKICASCHSSRQYVPDEKVTQVIATHLGQAESMMGEVIASVTHDLPVSWEEESPLATLLASGLRSWVDAEVGLVNSGTLLFSLPKGDITRKDLLAVCPHPINPCRMKLTGEQLLGVLEEALDASVIHKEVRGFGFRGKVIGWLGVDGADIYYDRTAAVGKRIRRVEIQGTMLQKDRIYTVGIIDMFTFGVVFPIFKQGTETMFYLPEFLRDVLGKQLQNEQAVQDAACRHWHVL
ncbi:bifunctional metallophosphatase/5'-nucleotidase [Aneurinibacillus sp. REN35]|uniref:bifunctional metallophosphatase/5'-nucleotidase n=1 Tax=Aneurinibacillus sp. REN35 TaxID=3237286 RepID=UPI0035273FA4